jgi:hypothetical protein
MPGGHEDDLARQLIQSGMPAETSCSGMPAETSCIVVSRATRPDEQVVETTLGKLPDLPKLPAPAILLIGTARPHVPAESAAQGPAKADVQGPAEADVQGPAQAAHYVQPMFNARRLKDQ